jgi:phosphatidylserine decarboxylase
MRDGLDFLYNTNIGRFILKGLTARKLSQVAGSFLDSGASRFIIDKFAQKNNIDVSECIKSDFDSFNDFFTRQLKPGMREFDMNPNNLVAPCDGLLSVYPIKGHDVYPIKQSRYSIVDLLRDKGLAAEFEGGTCMIYRLCVNHYHRYSYLDSGKKGANIFIPGVLHTVRPIALRDIPVFTENCREYTVMDTENFGKVVQVEVGAMLVGKIHNYHSSHEFVRGEEKGMFLYGGSTIVVLLTKDAAEVSREILECTRSGGEYPVKMGQIVGCKK